MTAPQISDFLGSLNAGDSIDFSWNNDPKCPHCGHVSYVADQEWYHLYDEGEHDVECPACERPFIVSTHVTYTFCTDEQDDLEENSNA